MGLIWPPFILLAFAMFLFNSLWRTHAKNRFLVLNVVESERWLTSRHGHLAPALRPGHWCRDFLFVYPQPEGTMTVCIRGAFVCCYKCWRVLLMVRQLRFGQFLSKYHWMFITGETGNLWERESSTLVDQPDPLPLMAHGHVLQCQLWPGSSSAYKQLLPPVPHTLGLCLGL